MRGWELLTFALLMSLAFGPLGPVGAAPDAPATQPAGEDQKAPDQAASNPAPAGDEAPAQATTQPAAEKEGAKDTDKAVEEKEKAKQKAERPIEYTGPTRIQFLVFVIDIDAIDGASQNFQANVFLRLVWKDSRLATDDASSRQVPLTEIWNPNILLVNQQGILRPSMPEVALVSPEGEVRYVQRYVSKLSQPLVLSDFPLDEHAFTVRFVAIGHEPGDLEFVPEEMDLDGNTITGGAISDELSLPDWKIKDYHASAQFYEPIKGVRVPGFVFVFNAKRYFLYYLWQLIMPLVAVVALAWASLWITLDQPGSRIGVAGSAILTLIAYRFVMANLLPPLPYMTRMDYLVLGCTLLVLLAMLDVILTSTLFRRGHPIAAGVIERWVRIALPVLFITIFFVTMFT